MNKVRKKGSVKEREKETERERQRDERKREKVGESEREREQLRCEKREPQHLYEPPKIAVLDGCENGDIDDFSVEQSIIIIN